MIADHSTKPLKEKMFKMFHDLVMGYVHINDLLQTIDLSARECVDNSKNVTENSSTNNRRIIYADVCKAPKKEYVIKAKENTY